MVTESDHLLNLARRELIRAWTAAKTRGQVIGYREWKRRKRIMRAIRETLEAVDV